MLVTFTCNVYPNTTYFGDVAQTLFKMMGHSGTVPGAIVADDVPKYLARLQSALDNLKGSSASNPSSNAKAPEDWKDQPVAIAQRALPLVELLSAAAKAQCDVMWSGK